MFAARTLLTLVAIVLIECVVATIVRGPSVGLRSLESPIAVQTGYLGVYLRSVLERAGIVEPDVRPQHRL
jgi:hypothetical protein